MLRKRMPENLDKKIFRRTAVSSKKINIAPTMYRGGIRF